MDGESRVSGVPPRVPSPLLPRPRLIERLDTGPDAIVVQGPLGAGKTTLLAAWAAEADGTVFWCEPREGRLPFAEIEEFVAPGGRALVIDRAERVGAEDLRRLGRLIDSIPRLRVILATRSARTLPEFSASTDAVLDLIGPAELRFTAEELGPVGLDADARDALLRVSDGLAVAVRSKLEEMRLGASGARERLRRLLREELDEGAPGEYETARRLSLLPRIDREALAAWGVSDRTVTALDAVGVVEWDGEWASMHPYLRGVLAEEAERSVPEEERHALIAAAVRSSLIRRDPQTALRAAFDAEDFALATEVVLANMVELLEARDATYASFQRVPLSRLRGHPALKLTLVLLSNMAPDTRPRAVQLLATESLFQRVQPNRGSHRERVLYRAFEAAALRLTPFAGRALPLVRSAVEEFLGLSDEDQEALGRMGPMLITHLGIAAFYAGDLELAETCFDLAYARYVEAGLADRVDPLSLQGGLAALGGDLPRARRLLAEADGAEWPPGWRGSSPADFFNLGMAVLALEDGDLPAIDRHLAAAGPIEDIVEHWRLFALLRARRDRLAGEVEAGLLRLQLLRQRRGSAPGTPGGKSILDIAEAELLLSAGRPQLARRVIERAAGHSPTARIVLARVELELGRTVAAMKQAGQLLQRPGRQLRGRLEAGLVLACAALRSGHDRDAAPAAERAVELLRVTGLRAPLRTIPRRDRAALVEALISAGLDASMVPLVSTEFSPVEAGGDPVVVLTRRERATLRAFAEEETVEGAAQRMFVSRNTVKSHLRSVYRKLGVSSRDAALARATALGLLDDGEAEEAPGAGA